MNISFIELNISGAENVQSAADRLKEILSTYGECDFKLCGTMQQISASLNQAFAKAGVIVVGIEPSAFATTKLAVLRAMHLKTELDPRIKDKLIHVPDIDSRYVAMHSAVPVGADVFLSESGFCSGFAVVSGDQTFLMLPLDKTVVLKMMRTGVEPYFLAHGIESKRPNQAADAVYLAQAELLRKLKKKVYFASTPSLEHFRDLYGTGNDDAFVFDSYSAKRKNEAPKDYLADLARYSIPDGEENALGAAISNIFTGQSQNGEDRYNVYIALSDGYSSRVVRFISQPDETPDELMEAAYEMLLDMIEEKCREADEPQDEESSDFDYSQEIYEEETRRQKKARRFNGITAAVFAVLSILIALAVLLFVKGMHTTEQSNADAGKILASNAQQREEEENELSFWFGVENEDENETTEVNG